MLAVPAQGLQRKPVLSSVGKLPGKAVLGDEERLGLNLRKCGSQRTSGDPEAGAAERPRCAEDGGEAACRMERTEQ
ncbi:protein of unknown function [Bradyrhizobium vignae]|uniref:Uncharacterized protein n=1 Tax=Bradyrhizobium vignae TaxID=1549949 RepID=A0A2U3PSQ9_9BRAD|nr:protein of unknown function [Bradyrhizobium vignae]